MTSRRKALLVGGGAVVLGLGGAAGLAWRQMGSMADFEAAAMQTRAVLPAAPEIRDLIRYATLAANGHNTQAWLFRPGDNAITILPDMARRTPVVDPDDHHVFVSLGCAAENLMLAAGAAGRSGEIVYDPTGDGAVVARFGGSNGEPALFDAIPHRQSTRSDYDGSVVSASDLALLAAMSAVPGVDVVLVTERAQMTRIADLVIAGNAVQIADPAFVAELKHWLRFSPVAALRAGDGLFSVASGNPALPEWLGPRLFDLVFTEKAETAKYAGQIATSAGIAVFSGAAADPEHWVQVGRSCQRFSLQATAMGLKSAYVNQPVEVPALRAELAALVGLPGRRPDIVMRFGRAPAMPYSARRPVDTVMI
jgi:hypothetical protein